MVHNYETVLHQLDQLGVRPGRIFSGEVRALSRILLEDEVIEQYMTGRYDAGPAIMVATNKRLLLVDKKPFNLTIEDIPYDMVSEVAYNVQAFNAFITIHSISKTVHMMSFRQSMLRRFAGFVQARVMHIRATRQVYMNPVQQMAGGQQQPYQVHQMPAQQYYSQQPYAPPVQN